MSFNFPSSPAEGDTYTTPNGRGYVYTGGVWKVSTILDAQRPAWASDTPPLNPQVGQLWWESDSGRLFIWFDDGSSKQWVQISGPLNDDAPDDGNEYVRVGGVWRLTKSSVGLAGLAFATLTVPTWGPSWGRMAFFGLAALHYPIMRYSFDGTTFPSGASDYAHSYFYCYGGTAGVNNAGAYVTANNIMLAPSGDHASIPHTCDGLFKLKKEGGAMLTWQLRGSTYYSQAANLHSEIDTRGWVNAAGATDVKAVRVYTSGGQLWSQGRFTMEWLP